MGFFLSSAGCDGLGTSPSPCSRHLHTNPPGRGRGSACVRAEEPTRLGPTPPGSSETLGMCLFLDGAQLSHLKKMRISSLFFFFLVLDSMNLPQNSTRMLEKNYEVVGENGAFAFTLLDNTGFC